MEKDIFGQLKKTVGQFNEQCALFSPKRSDFKGARIRSFLQSEFKELTGKLKICEVGGGNGILLRELEEIFGSDKVDLAMVELTEAYRKNVVSPSINFIHGSILGPEISKEKYDIIIVREVIHHLVGETLKETLANQRKAIQNIFDFVKPNGLVIIDEQVNDRRWASTLIYYLSLSASMMRLRIKKYKITPNTIVYFWSRQLLKNEALNKNATLVYEKYRKIRHLRWYWKITLLMNDIGHYITAFRKGYDEEIPPA